MELTGHTLRVVRNAMKDYNNDVTMVVEVLLMLDASSGIHLSFDLPLPVKLQQYSFVSLSRSLSSSICRECEANSHSKDNTLTLTHIIICKYTK